MGGGEDVEKWSEDNRKPKKKKKRGLMSSPLKIREGPSLEYEEVWGKHRGGQKEEGRRTFVTALG